MQSENKKFKIIIIGEGLVGKTCILLRYTDKPFNENTLATIGKFFEMFYINSRLFLSSCII